MVNKMNLIDKNTGGLFSGREAFQSNGHRTPINGYHFCAHFSSQSNFYGNDWLDSQIVKSEFHVKLDVIIKMANYYMNISLSQSLLACPDLKKTSATSFVFHSSCQLQTKHFFVIFFHSIVILFYSFDTWQSIYSPSSLLQNNHKF